LAFYESVTIEDGIYVPVGNQGWYPRGGERARYAQQPLEAVALVDAELAAFAVAPEASYLANAELGLAWYHGKNSRGAVMAANGGCFDGLSADGVNHNMGAESSLSYLAASYSLADHRGTRLRIASG
ncbi:MAG: glycosyltransferase, partial [Vulcanimicrobiaceae bacterium]